MAEVSSRVLWKGAISFGLVHIPVGLHSATSELGLDFDWLDKRSMDPVGYKRINKKTGKDISKENIVKGIAYEEGQYVVLSDQEIAEAYPKTTQTIEIEAFVKAVDIPFVYLERPYYVAPINKGAKVYALLRETLLKTGKVGVARVVIQTRQHLAALIPSGRGMVLNLLRWGDEVKTLESLELPAAGSKGVGAAELKMAKQLIAEMSGQWDPADFKDEFRHQVMKLVEKKAQAGDSHTVVEPEEESPTSGEVIDLTALLQRSLRGGAAPAGKAPAGKAPAKKAVAKKAPAGRTPAKKTRSPAAPAPQRKAA